jgi:hypothetical protein
VIAAVSLAAIVWILPTPSAKADIFEVESATEK